VNAVQVISALAPVALTILLLFRYKAHVVAPVVLVVGVALAMTRFGTSAGTVAASLWHALPVTTEVLVIVLGGLWLSSALAAAGVNDTVSAWISSLGLSTPRLVVLVVLGITPFAESITGFGVGAVIAIPILLAAGLAPARAAICGLLGFVAVPWGALAPGTLIAAQLARVDFHELGVLSAILSLPVYLVCGFAALTVVVGLGGAWRRSWDIVGVSLLLWLSVWGANQLLGTQLAGAVGAAVATAGYLVAATRTEWVRVTFSARLRTCLAPYAVLCGFVCLGRLVQAVLPASAPELVSRAVASPALWLLVTCLLLGVILRRLPVPDRLAATCFPVAVRKWFAVAVATAGFLFLGSIMTDSGISATLAEAGATLGAGYLPIVPVVGAIGGFLTGSNSGANAMFASSQALAAHTLGTSPVLVVALNNVAGSMATMASSPRIALATGLVSVVPAERSTGLDDDRLEHKVFRTMLAVVGIIVAIYAMAAPLIVALSR
jgi:lactate permease